MNEVIKTAYFDRQQITLHQMVVQYRYPDMHELKPKTYMVVSNDQSHNSGAGYPLIKAVLPFETSIDRRRELYDRRSEFTLS